MLKWFLSRRGKEDNTIITPRYKLGDASSSFPTGVPGDALLAGQEQGEGRPSGVSTPESSGVTSVESSQPKNDLRGAADESLKADSRNRRSAKSRGGKLTFAPQIVQKNRLPIEKRVVAVPSRYENLSALNSDRTEIGSLDPIGVDLRLHGNEIYLGGCWGSVDVQEAVNLRHQTRLHLPPPQIMVPSDEITRTFNERQDWTVYQMEQAVLAPKSLKADILGKYLV